MAQRTRSPLVSSVNALRGIAAGITMLTLTGMTAYAGGHLHNAAAPLQPVATAAPATTGRLRLAVGVPTTTTRAVTTTHHS